MWGARVSLGLLRPTRRARSNPGLLCLRRSVHRYVIPLVPSENTGAKTRGAGQDLAWAHVDGVRAVFARFLKCVRAVAHLSTVLEKSPADGISGTLVGILVQESITWRRVAAAGRLQVSPLCRMIRVQTSPLCRKILGHRQLAATGSRCRTSPFCRMMERISPLPHPPRDGIGGESGGNRPSGGSSERRRSASRRPSKGPSGRHRGGMEPQEPNEISTLTANPSRPALLRHGRTQTLVSPSAAGPWSADTSSPASAPRPEKLAERRHSAVQSASVTGIFRQNGDV